MVANDLDYSRLIFLDQKIKSKTATKEEKDEYMSILYRNGNITKQQYDSYLSGNTKTEEEILKTALTIGGILLVAYLISKLFK
jgi:hypothetical protein